MFRISLLAVLALASVALAQESEKFSAPSSQAGNLEWKFQKGQTLKVTMVQASEQSMKMLGNDIKQGSDTTTWMRWTTNEVNDDGSAQVATVIDRIKLEMNMPGQAKIVADTQSDEEPAGMAAQLMSTFKPMVGAESTQRMTALGKISEVVLPKGIEDAVKIPGVGGMSEMLKSMTENASPVFPSKTMKVGQSWTSNTETKSPVGTVELKNTYTYRGTTKVKGKELHAFDVDVTMNFKEGDNALGAKITVTKQDTQGTMYFDGVAGRLAGSEVKQDMTMQISVGGQEIEQVVKQTTSVNVEAN